MSDWSDDIAKIKVDNQSYIGNPLNAFKLIKRNSIDLAFYDIYFPGFKQQIEVNDTDFPNNDDLIGAIAGLIRLQKVYKLKTEDLANGILHSVDTGVKLSPHDLFTIGVEAFETVGEKYLAHEYLRLAQSRNYDNSGVEQSEIFEVLFKLYLANNDVKNAEGILEHLSQRDKEHLAERYQESFNRVRSLPQEQVNGVVNPFNDTFTHTGHYSADKEFIIFRRICNLEVTKSPKEQSKLFCKFHSTNAFTKIAPFKVEVANMEPELLIFIDVLSENETSTIKNMFFDTITKNAHVMSGDGKKISDIEIRVADLHWFNEETQEHFETLTRRLEASLITNFIPIIDEM